MKKHLLYITIFTLLVGCDQSEWLDVKSNKADVVPSTLEDYQALLNDYETMNRTGPALGDLASDNYYTTEAIWSSVDEYDRNSYIWASHISEYSYDWQSNYNAVSIANIVLEGIEKFSSEQNLYQQMKGTALFLRALYFFNLAQQYAKPYDETTSQTDLGIVLKLTSAVDESVKRSSVEETYLQIIRDLNDAVILLPTHTSLKTKPTKNAAIALLGKVYFYMEKYDKALEYLEDALEAQNELLDFNSLNTSANLPFPNFQLGNKEIVFFERRAPSGILNTASRRLIAKDGLYDLYEDNDLRKVLYFNATNINAIRFKGFYTGLNSQDFSGIATNELHLTLAECYIRLGNRTDALILLNKLLHNRYITNTFSDIEIADNEELLRNILLERNKELPFTGIIRWMDLRRLNKDPRFAITLTRTVLGETYTLPPNDKRYVLPLPENEIRINGLQQNER